MMRVKRIWITWEKHRRTCELVASLGNVKLHVLEYNGARAIRYPYLLSKTFLLLMRERPDLVIVQNPSVVLAFFMVTVGRVLVRSIVIDAHNEGLRPFYRNLCWLLPVYRLIKKRADLTLVTNDELAREVRENKGRPFVLQDRLPEFPRISPISLKGRVNVVCISTFEKDEPYREVLKAAELLDPSTVIYMTGDSRKAPRNLVQRAPENIVFTGFLPEPVYLAVLFSCDMIMDLTLMEDCLVCGAYEAVAMGKPVILSDTRVLREYFFQGVRFTKNDARSIAAAVQLTTRNLKKLEAEVTSLKEQLRSDWEMRRAELTHTLNSMCSVQNQHCSSS